MSNNAHSTKPKIVAMVGPTASGKTKLSIELAKKFDGEIVSADSRQIYRGMDIGTAKPTRDKRQETGDRERNHSLFPITCSLIPHWLIDIRNPDEDYTVAEYKEDAEQAIADILKRNKLPIIVGGTGLYIRAVLENLDIPKIKADATLRAQIEKDIAERGLATVFKTLIEKDPEAAYIVDPKNPRRVIRALEVAISTGEPFTTQRKKSESHYEALKIGINPPTEILRERINQRIDDMMQDDLVSEVKNLIKKYPSQCTAFDAIGYREIIAYLNGTTSIEKAITDMKLNTWHYAKRQITWFKRDHAIQWLQDVNTAQSLTENFLTQ